MTNIEINSVGLGQNAVQFGLLRFGRCETSDERLMRNDGALQLLLFFLVTKERTTFVEVEDTLAQAFLLHLGNHLHV